MCSPAMQQQLASVQCLDATPGFAQHRSSRRAQPCQGQNCKTLKLLPDGCGMLRLQIWAADSPSFAATVGVRSAISSQPQRPTSRVQICAACTAQRQPSVAKPASFDYSVARPVPGLCELCEHEAVLKPPFLQNPGLSHLLLT